jgi:hypothetical protein
MATCYFQVKHCNSTSNAKTSGQLVSPTFVKDPGATRTEATIKQHFY